MQKRQGFALMVVDTLPTQIIVKKAYINYPLSHALKALQQTDTTTSSWKIPDFDGLVFRANVHDKVVTVGFFIFGHPNSQCPKFQTFKRLLKTHYEKVTILPPHS
jgi:hypothetical protein